MVSRTRSFILFALTPVLLLSPTISSVRAQEAQEEVVDPLDPFDLSAYLNITTDEDSDKGKSADKLLGEGYLLLSDERLLDARTKFLRALKAEPNNYKAHFMLSGYYMVHVGHFRLALKYIKRAMELFETKYGPPPYKEREIATEHKNLLYYLSQIRLNLDNYQGALDTLDEYSSYGYSDEWYAGSRAWIQMKLGRIDDAILAARMGVMSGAEKGRTLNMLGILLSMKGERQESLNVFRDAIRYEFSMGEGGQPATPLNNSGEVYKEIFSDEKAESSWLKATSLPDGCEHVLPSLNLALLYIDQINPAGAKKAMDGFATCVAQFPLRNGEEHRALVALARGRIEMMTGHVAKAVSLFEDALDGIQWFGKIGTSHEDLQAGATISLAQGLERLNNHLAAQKTSSIREWLSNVKTRSSNSMRAWWLKRRVRQILTEELLEFEDIYVRNTDSMLEYPTLGEITADLPTVLLKRKLGVERKADDRASAAAYYDAYLGENLLSHGRRSGGVNLLRSALGKTRDRFDALLKVHLLARIAKEESQDSESYRTAILVMFALQQAAPRNYGLPLPVNIEKSSTGLADALDGTPFLPNNAVTLPYTISYKQNGDEHILFLASQQPRVVANVEVREKSLAEAINKLSDRVFSIELS